MVQEKRVTRKAFSAAIGAVALLAVLAMPASAATDTKNKSISCDAVSWTYANGLYPYGGGTLSIRYNSSAQAYRTSVRLWVDTGPSTELVGTKNFLQTQTLSWSGLEGGDYFFQFKKYDTPTNCNGSSPGHGNYTINYTVTY